MYERRVNLRKAYNKRVLNEPSKALPKQEEITKEIKKFAKEKDTYDAAGYGLHEHMCTFELISNDKPWQKAQCKKWIKNHPVECDEWGPDCDFCEMLYRMYSKYFLKKGFSTKIIDYLEGDEAGIKSITLKIDGENSYGYFKSESGVHRLVRLSPFNAQNKRQTSFASVDVIPDIKDDINIDIKDDDLKIDYYRASGAGGQHVNKTSSAVRITHIPTGIVVQSQEERYQAINKENCMKMLKVKLLMIEKNKVKDKISNIRGDIKDNSFGSQIRNYILQPYKLVKDLRTGEETSDADGVLNGNIENFIMAYLRWIKLGCPDRKVMSNE